MSPISTTTPIIITLVYALIAWVASKARHESSGGVEIYRYPPSVGWLMVASGFLFLCLPFLGGEGDVPPVIFFAFFAVWSALAFTAAAYFFRYRVIVGDAVLKFGTLRYETIPLAEVVDTEVTAGRNGKLLVYLRSGRRLKFSNMLADFADLADTLSSRRTIDSPGTGASIQKLQDQRRRVSLVRRLNWMAGIAVAVLILIAFIKWLRH